MVTPANNPRIYSEHAYSVELDDEGGGEFVLLADFSGSRPDKTAIDDAAWPALLLAIQQAFDQIKRHEMLQSEQETTDELY
ncbi:MAG: hypothetical protein VBE63_18290 [Lamprobacter sp.]|uniref:hypothetical protein n=1 Tax=Lamprobacter sp. TaxID=3100796 RepID=UPI002B25D6C9|nr:hypothetical protein [Lamprobacter sp.]MEA3641865.1 hypothetical protein [Lamprobacter sp.]